jgi:hypothetical protein
MKVLRTGIFPANSFISTAKPFVGREKALVELHKCDRYSIQKTCQSQFLKKPHHGRESDNRASKETSWYNLALVLGHDELASKGLPGNWLNQLAASEHWHKRSISCQIRCVQITFDIEGGDWEERGKGGGGETTRSFSLGGFIGFSQYGFGIMLWTIVGYIKIR